jgi:hypothetical protein
MNNNKMNGGKSNSENNKMNGKSNSEVYSLFIKEKASEASLRRSLTQAGKERDYAYNEMKKSQLTHQLAVAKHEKLQHEARDTLLPDGVGIHVGVDNDGKNDGLSTMGSVGVNSDGNGHCGTGEFDNEEEANDALLTQAAKETEVLWATGQMKKVSATSEDAGSPHKEKGSSALAIISPERKVNEKTNNVKAKASAPHLSIGSVDTLKPAAALAKRARKAK